MLRCQVLFDPQDGQPPGRDDLVAASGVFGQLRADAAVHASVRRQLLEAALQLLARAPDEADPTVEVAGAPFEAPRPAHRPGADLPIDGQVGPHRPRAGGPDRPGQPGPTEDPGVNEPASPEPICPRCEQPVEHHDRFCELVRPCPGRCRGAHRRTAPSGRPRRRGRARLGPDLGAVQRGGHGAEPGLDPAGRAGPAPAPIMKRRTWSWPPPSRTTAIATSTTRTPSPWPPWGTAPPQSVCDGVSTTASPGRASAAAARAAMSVLEEALVADEWPSPADVEDILGIALDEACRAVARVPVAPGIDQSQLPSTTIVAALVGEGAATVANVGDSRAYWLSGQPGTSRQLTVDDSWAEEAIAAGMAPAEAHQDAQAHVITQWLAADVEELTWHVDRVDPPATGGLLLVCTDGLWNDLDTPDALLAPRAAQGAIPDGSRWGTDEQVELVELAPLAVARTLVAAALKAGGHDNVTVAVIPLPAAPETPSTSQPTIQLPDARPLAGRRPPTPSHSSPSPAPDAPA